MLDPVQLTKELVSINSVNPFRTISHNGREYGIGNEEKINDYLEEKLKHLGFEVSRHVYQEEQRMENSGGPTEVIPKRWNVLAQKGRGKKSVLLLAHTDTVDIKEGWLADPFVGYEKEVDGEMRYYALGSCDMKAGIAVILSSVENLAPKDYNLKIAFVSDEEFWSFGADALVKSDFLKDVKLCLVPEIMDKAPKDVDTSWLGVGRVGRAEFLVEIFGVACHGADAFISSSAVNAVHESVKLQNELIPFLKSSKKVFLEDNISVVNSIYINSHNGGRGMLSIPDYASFIIDHCLVPGETPESELNRYQEFIHKQKVRNIIDQASRVTISLRSRPTPTCDPYCMAINSDLTNLVVDHMKKHLKKIEYGIGRSVADENRIAKLGIPTYIIPPRGGDCHTNSEWLSLSSLSPISNVFSSILNSSDLINYI